MICRHQQYVGPMSYVSIDETTSTNRGVVVASETGILALIDSHSGELGVTCSECTARVH